MEQVCALTRLAGAALSGKPVDAPSAIDPALAEAHQIAPLLNIALGAAQPELAALFDQNVRRQAESRSILLDIAALSTTHGFAWLVVGGQPQAAQLYPDCAWRASGEPDILIGTGEADTLVGILRNAGWSPASASSKDRSTMLVDAAGRRVRLHERLLFTPGPIGALLVADGAYRPRRSRDSEDIPAPPVGAAMALDILLRGHAWRWSRLKYLFDLSAVLGRLDEQDQARLIDMIGEARIEPLAIASLLTCRTMLGDGLPAMIGRWLDSREITPEIATRRTLYRDALDRSASPPATLPPTQAGRIAKLGRAVTRFVHALTPRLMGGARQPGQYQRAPDTMADRYPLAFRFAQDQLGDGAAIRILSFGCSTGEEVFTLRRYFPQAVIRGIEIDPTRVRICRNRLRETGDTAISFACAADATGEPPESHDAIFCMAVFRDPALDAPETRSTMGHITFDDFERGMADLVRCLKPGGLLFVEHSNFRVSDTGSAPALEPVLHADPPRSAKTPGLYGRDGRRIEGAADLALGYRKRASSQGHDA